MVEAARVDLRPRGQQRGRRVAAAHVTRPQERGPGAGVLGLNLVTDIVDIYVDTDEGLYIYADIVDICVDADIVDICVDTDTDSGFISSYRWSRPHLGAAVQQQLTAVRPRLPGGVVQRRAALAIPDLEIRPVVFE